MSTSERRRDARIRCRLSLTLRGEWADVDGTVVDISRTGFRLRMSLEEIGLERGVGLTKVARQLHHLLTEDVVANFLPELLGPLVVRRIQPRAIALPGEDPCSVDLGALFDSALGPVEAAALGLPIPMDQESPEEASARSPVQPPRVHMMAPGAAADTADLWDVAALRPRAEIRAYLVPVLRPRSPQILARVEGVTEGRFTVRVLDRDQLTLPTGVRNAASLTAAFYEHYGEDMTIRLDGEEGTLWSGSARVEGVEVPESADDTVLLHLDGGEDAPALDSTGASEA